MELLSFLSRAKTFPDGGIHPPGNKLTSDCPVKKLPIPERVVIPVSQHAGSPAEIIVNKGDIIRTGLLIARSKGFVSSNIHSSVSGSVSKIDTVIDSSGYKQAAVFIDTAGDEWVDTIEAGGEINPVISLQAGEIIEKCFAAGIVGLGGAAFPSHVKLSVPAGKRCDLLIINGAECEPYLTSDHRLMVERGEEILIGASIMMKALGVTRAMIGIELNKPDAISNLESLSRGFKGITVHPLKIKYPQGAEKQLIKSLVNREVPSGSLPLDVNCVVHNAGTALAVYEAVQKNKPLFERVVTVTGKSLSAPGNFLVRIGTPVGELIKAAGGIPGDTGKIVMGGPMMGKSLINKDVPVVKGTSGIVIFPLSESSRGPISKCIRCAKCVSACPSNLEPFLLMALSEKGLFERAGQERITDCMECGSCSYTCPAGKPILDYIRLGKSTVIRNSREKFVK